jgi:hypothetical protein
MSKQTEDVGALAAPHVMTRKSDGKRFSFRHIGGVELSSYQVRRYHRERDALRELREDYGSEAFATRLDELRERFDRGEFDLLSDIDRTGIRAGLTAATSLRAGPVIRIVLDIMHQMTGESDEDNWKLFFEQKEETGRMVKLIIEESFPNSERPEGSNGKTPAEN